MTSFQPTPFAEPTGRRIRVRAGDTLVQDGAWSYPDPISENPKIRDLVAFFQERMDIVVDGVRLARSATPWSTPDGVAEGDLAHRDR
jgi:nucleotidyltransferase-like protein